MKVKKNNSCGRVFPFYRFTEISFPQEFSKTALDLIDSSLDKENKK